ncbi:DUF4037 domain-containing protein [Streptomyces massasporeus]|uniref:DUF4037 domain-containing protein n=1 Tax=Streptomyces massasporeus TaxID=67324 RepID=UPI0036C4AD71
MAGPPPPADRIGRHQRLDPVPHRISDHWADRHIRSTDPLSHRVGVGPGKAVVQRHAGAAGSGHDHAVLHPRAGALPTLLQRSRPAPAGRGRPRHPSLRRPPRQRPGGPGLAIPTQRLAEVTAGAIFHDGLGRLIPARAQLAWYPHDLWLHVLACQWQRISQEEAFVGRCGEVDDELGSAVIAARLVRDLMRLCLLMDRRYPPYSKWLGSAFARTPQAAVLTPALSAALTATDWHTREHHLARAYETVAAAHNQLGLTDPVDPTTRTYHSRPFQVLHAERFTAALTARITDQAVRALPLTGTVDQFVDSTDVLSHPGQARVVTRATTSVPQS